MRQGPYIGYEVEPRLNRLWQFAYNALNMSRKPKQGTGVSVEASLDKFKTNVSEGALTKLGEGIAWLFPKRDAKVKITAALAARVTAKIRKNKPLNDDELYFVSRVYDKDARQLMNVECVSERVLTVLPEVNRRITALPSDSAQPKSSPETFVCRAETLAGEVLEEDIREIFARVLAGELCRPGSFSVRVLDVIRSLDRDTAGAFNKIANYLLDTEFLIFEDRCEEFFESNGMDRSIRMDLQDAGLLAPLTFMSLTLGEPVTFRYHERAIRATYDYLAEGMAVPMPTFPVLRLTRVGRDIARVLPFEYDEAYFKTVLNALVCLETITSRNVEWNDRLSDTWNKA